jgi:hypothetical protein
LPVFASFDFVTKNVNQGQSLTAKMIVTDTQAMVDVFLLTPSSLKLPLDSYVFNSGESYEIDLDIKSLFLSADGAYYLIAVNSETNKLLASDSFAVVDSGFSLAKLFGVGGDDQLLAQAADSDDQEKEIIAGIQNPRFEFVDFPQEVQQFDDVTFELRALTVDGDLDSEYLGTINFEVLDDPNATLPTEFTFEEDNAGIQQFNTSVSFSKSGEQILRVFDIDDETLEAAVKINVIAQADDNEPASKITLESPLPGVTNSNRILFKGTTDVGVDVRIFENNVLLESTSSNAEGAFSVTTSPLADGDYSFVVKTDNAESAAVNITIDSLTASLVNSTITPPTPSAGQVFEINLTFDSEVASASIIIDGVQTDLVASDNSKKRFKTSLAAPLLPDNYDVSVVVLDQSGTSNSFRIQQPLTIIEAPSDSIVTDGGALDSDQFVIPDFTSRDVFGNPPTKPTGVVASVQDKRVDLAWQASADDLGIAFYSIRYGKNPDNLDFGVETATDETAWFIPNLDSDTRYYFQVFAIDLDGNASAEGSDLIFADIGRPDSTSYYGNADPGTDVLVDGIDASVGGPDLSDLTTSETGPSNVLALVFSFLGGGYIVNRKRKK